MLTRSITDPDLSHKSSLRITTPYPKDYNLLPKRLMINIRDHHDHHHHDQNQDHYHGGSSVSIPFTWESQPGTPKVVKFRETSLPPLTPPPSYCYSPVTKRPSQPNNNNTNLVKSIFPRKKLFSIATHSPSSLSPSASSLSNSDYSSPAATPSKSWGLRGRRNILEYSSPRVSVDSRATNFDADGDDRGSPVSTLCFGRSGVNNARARPAGCYSSLIKVLLS